jgi:hypothetical protein
MSRQYVSGAAAATVVPETCPAYSHSVTGAVCDVRTAAAEERETVPGL